MTSLGHKRMWLLMFYTHSFNKLGPTPHLCVCRSVCVQLICSLMTLSTWCSAVEWLSVWINWRGVGGQVSGPTAGIEGLRNRKGEGHSYRPHGEGTGSGLSGWDKCVVTREVETEHLVFFLSVTCHRHVEDLTWRWFTIKGGCLDTSKIPYLQHYLSLNITANWIIFFGGHPWPITAV